MRAKQTLLLGLLVGGVIGTAITCFFKLRHNDHDMYDEHEDHHHHDRKRRRKVMHRV